MSGRPELVAALADLPGAGAHRLGRLLADTPVDTAWARVLEGRVAVDVAPQAVRAQWRDAARATDPTRLAARLGRLGVVATSWHHDGHPPAWCRDIDPAPVAFRSGRLPPASLPHVAVIGTRRASATGREVARELGAGLAAAGVVVVSGLALGIDGAAHRGALSVDGAPPLAIVGSGIDIVYPARHTELWGQVAARGAVVSEAPLGAEPAAWRFPARNRLLAAVSDLVVVVESRAAGGSMHTVEQAIRRGIDVMAVPGSVRNGAAAGTNQLLSEGCAPVCGVDDVLVALGLGPSPPTGRPGPTRAARADPHEAAVEEAVDDGPTSVDALVAATGLPVGTVMAALGRLEAAGRVVADGARVRRAGGDER